MRRLLPKPLRSLLRRAAGGLAARAGTRLAAAGERILRLTGRRAGVALVYHRVGEPPGDPEREISPALSTGLLEAQIAHLKTRYRLVAASELQAAAAARRRGDPFPVALTFDDDLASHASDAAPALKRHDAPATFFLNGATLEAPRPFWWDSLQRAVDRGAELEPRLAAAGGIREAATVVEQLPPREREELAERLAQLADGEPPVGLSAAAVEALARDGFEIGFHTLRHHPLTQLSADELRAALRDGRDTLQAAAGRQLDAIAYPHGRADSRVAQAAREAGFDCGFTTRPRPVTAGSDPLLLGRVEAPFASAGALALRVLRTLLRRG